MLAKSERKGGCVTFLDLNHQKVDLGLSGSADVFLGPLDLAMVAPFRSARNQLSLQIRCGQNRSVGGEKHDSRNHAKVAVVGEDVGNA
jgi:hypothetical protein